MERITRLFLAALLFSAAVAPAQTVATSDKAYRSQLSGTVVDSSGAAIIGATVDVRSANGAVRRTIQADMNGSFILPGLPAGDYRLAVSNPGFDIKGISVTIGAAGASTPLRISLAVGSVSTTLNVQGREDDIIGIASSATQGTVGAKEIANRPILRSGEILEAVRRHHHATCWWREGEPVFSSWLQP